jgi:hypothetical protein
MTRSPTSNESRKTERGVGTSPLGRADAGYGGHALRHVGKNSATPEKLRTAGPVHDGPAEGFGVIPPKR